MTQNHSERGSATVMSIALSLLLIAGTVGSLLGIQTIVTVRRTQVAADLAALAGATVLGTSDACIAAEEVMARNHVKLQSCVASDNDVSVETWLPNPMSHWIALPRIVSQSRAGI